MIVLGTLFVYTYALSDDRMSKREQTMVSSFPRLYYLCSTSNEPLDIYFLRLPRPRFRSTEPRHKLWAHPKQDVDNDSLYIRGDSTGTDLCSLHATNIPDGCVELEGSERFVDASSNQCDIT